MKNVPENFQELRDQWALKAPMPSEDDMRNEMLRDQQANPHNEPYHNKKPRRERAEIISDRAYTFADKVLTSQYGSYYKNWLSDNGYIEKWNVVKKVM